MVFYIVTLIDLRYVRHIYALYPLTLCSPKKKSQSSALPEIALRRGETPSAANNSMQFMLRGVEIVQLASSPLFLLAQKTSLLRIPEARSVVEESLQQ